MDLFVLIHKYHEKLLHMWLWIPNSKHNGIYKADIKPWEIKDILPVAYLRCENDQNTHLYIQ